MANWCKGSLKVRGTKGNMTKFILEGLKPVGFLGMEDVQNFRARGAEPYSPFGLMKNTLSRQNPKWIGARFQLIH